MRAELFKISINSGDLHKVEALPENYQQGFTLGGELYNQIRQEWKAKPFRTIPVEILKREAGQPDYLPFITGEFQLSDCAFNLTKKTVFIKSLTVKTESNG